jgi:hypothetical protein
MVTPKRNVNLSTKRVPKSMPKSRPRASEPIVDSLKSIGSWRTPVRDVDRLMDMLESESPSDRWNACVDLTALAKQKPDEARKAAPVLMEAFKSWGPGTKIIVTETLAAIVDSCGNPREIVNPDFTRQLIRAVKETQKKLEQPSAIDRKDELERYMSSLKRILLTDGVAKPSGL